MGSDHSHQELLNVPVQGSKTQGFSYIYRNPKGFDRLHETPDEKLRTMKDVVLSSCKHKYPKNKYIGQVFIKNKGQGNDEREIVQFTYEEAFEISQNVGSNLYGEKLYQHEKLHDMKLIGIYSKNRYEWVMTDIACMLYGFTLVPLYDTLGEQNLTHCLENSEMSTCFVTESTVSTLLTLKGHGKLKNLISFDKLSAETEEKLDQHGFKVMYFSEMMKKPEKFHDHSDIKVEPQTCLTFSYTSGTTGPPKGAMLSHSNFLAFISGYHASDMEGLREDDIYLSFLPLPHVFERVMQAGVIYYGASSIFFNGDVTKIKDDCAFVRPTIFVAVPRIYNRIQQAIQGKISEAGGMKACLFNGGVKSKSQKLHKNGEYQSGMYDKVVFSKTKANFGGRIRYMITGSAPIRKQVFEFMKIIMCCPFYEGYGQTQNTAAAFITSKYDKQTGHVGGIGVSLQFKLANLPEMNYTSEDKDQHGRSTPRGQIWLRGPSVFMGYYKQKDKTEQALTEDGWLRTGDVGMLLPGTNAMKIIDRKKNIFKLQQGQYVASQKIEAIYSKSHLVNEVFLHGESTHNFAIAIVVLNKDQLVKIGKEHHINKNYEELCQDKKIRTLVCKQLNSIGKSQGLKGFQQAKNIHIVPTSFQEEGILTNTLKLQRFAAKKRFAKQIQNMYDEGPLDGKQ